MQTEHENFGLPALVRATLNLMALNWWRVIFAVVALAPIGVAIDLQLIDQAGNLLFTILAFVFQIWISEATLASRVARAQSGFGSGAALRATIVSQFAILLGLFLLIVPGVIAFVRWSMVVPVALSRRTNVHDSMKESWRRSDGHFWRALGLLTIAYLPLILAATLLVVADGQGPTRMLLDVAANTGLVLGLVAGWHAALALFFASGPTASASQPIQTAPQPAA